MSKPMHEAPQTETFLSHGTPQPKALPIVNYLLLGELLRAVPAGGKGPATVPLSAILSGKVPPFAGWRRSPSREDVALRRWWVFLEISLKRQALELHVSHNGDWHVSSARA